MLRLIEDADDDVPAQPVHADDVAAELARMRREMVHLFNPVKPERFSTCASIK